ncbi:V-type proton ATPase subunit G 3-like [Equus przewalskii]|uniref:V-type proton ATPase subunit G n=1 Tax=Equus przewalskii TaxID=9798 RepID=A0ABM4L2I0_EQUPR|nr:V-type proton ATPase subunit G 3-like [Equus caballus]
MTSQSQGIQQLLQAEKRAKDKLEEAKKSHRTTSRLNLLTGKGKRLKQAKEEAMAEIDQYRMQRDKEFRLKQSKIMGSQSSLSGEIEEQTQGQIKELNGSYSKYMENVMNQLLSVVCDVKPEIHMNYRITN